MSRLIDKEPNYSKRSVQIIVAGLGRTGTNSLFFALRELGYNPFHGFEYPKNPKRHFRLWNEAMKCCILEQGKPYGREEFERLLGPYDAVLDFPHCLLWRDLAAAYPEAKIVLTNRDPDDWLRSMQSTIFDMMQWRVWTVLRYVDWNETRPMMKMLETGFGIFCNNDYGQGARKAYLEHYEDVRKAIPKERLLEYNLGDGWEPLCAFLKLPLPKTAYPNTFAAENWQELNRREARRQLWKAVRRVSVLVAPVIAAALWLRWR